MSRWWRVVGVLVEGQQAAGGQAGEMLDVNRAGQILQREAGQIRCPQSVPAMSHKAAHRGGEFLCRLSGAMSLNGSPLFA
jgi:hypothetical protein